MKVSESKKKVCPFISHPEFDGMCICGDCMAWEMTNDAITSKKEIVTKEELDQLYLIDSHKTRFTITDLMDGTFELTYEEENKELSEDEKEGYCKRIGK